MTVYDKNTKKHVSFSPVSFEYKIGEKRYMKGKLMNGSRTDNYNEVVVKWSDDRQGWFIPEKKIAKQTKKTRVK